MEEHDSNEQQPHRSEPNASEISQHGGSGLWRWLLYLIGIGLFALLLRDVLYPFRDQRYVEISHGNHVHYLPKDRNENVPVSSFPMRAPGPNERITSDGDIVASQEARSSRDELPRSEN